MCREEASELASIRESITACGVRMVAIVKESLGVASFAEKFWRSDEIFLDEGHGFYKAVFGGKVSKVGLTNFLQRAIYSNYSRASTKGYSGDNAGEGRVLGGLFIVSLKGVHYEYPERTSGDHAPVEEVVAVVKSLAPRDVKVDSLDFTYARTAAVAASRAIPAGAVGIGSKPKTLEDAKAQGAKMLEMMKARQAAAAAAASTGAASSPASPMDTAPAPGSATASLPEAPSSSSATATQDGQCVDCDDMDVDK